MHRSRLAGICIDCDTEDLSAATDFWSAVLGYPRKPNHGEENYETLQPTEREISVEVQKVDHPSRVHLDIEADDVDAEVLRLESLGATKLEKIKDWWVMEAPTGQRFCVVPQQSPCFEETANRWDD
ncbi:MAG: VOC family protein [Woeseiaceae bacterium]